MNKTLTLMSLLINSLFTLTPQGTVGPLSKIYYKFLGLRMGINLHKLSVYSDMFLDANELGDRRDVTSYYDCKCFGFAGSLMYTFVNTIVTSVGISFLR